MVWVAAKHLRSTHPELKIIFVTSQLDPLYMEEAFRLGAHGYVLKRHMHTDVARAVREVLAVGTFRPTLA
jgi:DNA-binding NarL/FixJ family response regulator